MVSNCCIKGCANNTHSVKKNSTLISFHTFPSKPELRKKWLHAVGRPYWNPPSYARVCSEHFAADQINNDGTRIWIKEEAWPVENMPPVNSFSAADVEVCRVCLATDIRLFSLEYGQLRLCMEALAKLSDKNNTLDLPQYVCFECGTHMLKYNRLIEKSLIAQATLFDIFADNGRITKRLISQIDRKELNLHSSLGFSEPAPIVSVDLGNSCTSIHCSEHNDKNKIDICTDEIKNIGKEKNVQCNKIKQSAEKKRINSTSQLNKKNKNCSYDEQTEFAIEVVSINEDSNKDEINVKLETEGIVLDSDNTDVEKLDFKTEVTESTHDKIFKVEVAVSKCDKSDSDDDFIGSFETGKNDGKLNTESRSRTSKNYNTTEKGNIDSDTEDLKDIFVSLNKVSKSSESECNNEDDTINSDQLSDGDSSDNEVLQTLKNSSKFKKVTRKVKGNSKKPSPNTRKGKKTSTKKELGDKTTPEESAIAKLKCYKVTDMPLQEQIVIWMTENEQPMQYSQFKCEICTRKFVRKKAYEEHLPRHEPSRGNFKCPVCKEHFRNKTRFYSHITRNHAKKYECQKCPKVFYNLDKAQRHEIFHSGQVYSCPHCAFSTTHRSTAWEHVRTQHAHAHHCALCGHTFINAKGLGTHKAMSHPGQDGEPKTPFPCEQCNIVFHSEGALRVHKMVSKQHENDGKATGEPKPTCKRCGAVFPQARELWAHTQQQHRAPAARPPRARPRHAAADAYPRPCEHCSVELKSRFEHWCHVRREHPEHKHLYRSIVSAICATCGKGFQSKSMLIRHEQKHRGPATFACALCPRAFHDQYSLTKHARAHSAERPFPCPECGRAFKVKGNLERHRRMHTGETPYECKYCGKKFRYWESLTLHEKHMHQKVPWPTRERAQRRKRPAARAHDSAED